VDQRKVAIENVALHPDSRRIAQHETPWRRLDEHAGETFLHYHAGDGVVGHSVLMAVPSAGPVDFLLRDAEDAQRLEAV